MDLNEILIAGIEHKASDVLLSPGSSPCFRVDDSLIFSKSIPPLDAAIIKELLYSFMSGAQKQIFEVDHVLDFIITLPEKTAKFRVNMVEQANGIAAAIRVMPETIPTLDALEVPGIIKELVKCHSGLVLVVGSEGSGKSTTLSAMIDHINSQQAKHIITLENPIEFVYQNKKSLIDQRQLGNQGTFFEALRTALRSNPNVILVGEMRDKETVRLALMAAEAGQLVLSTIHAGSAIGAIRRMINLFPSSEKDIIRHSVSSVLRGIVFQMLVKKAAGGRVAAFEILLGTNATRNLINDNNMEQLLSVMDTNQEKGMRTLKKSFQLLLNKNIITVDAIPDYLMNMGALPVVD